MDRLDKRKQFYADLSYSLYDLLRRKYFSELGHFVRSDIAFGTSTGLYWGPRDLEKALCKIKPGTISGN